MEAFRKATKRPMVGDASGTILSLVASGEARTRLELTRVTGFSRSTVADRLAFLGEAGLVEERLQARPARGRPTRQLCLNPDYAVVLTADIGESHTQLTVMDLGCKVLAETGRDMDIHDGAVPMLEWIVGQFQELLITIGRGSSETLGIGLGLPAQIDFESGRVVAPSLMTGWEDFDIRGWLGARIDAPVTVENEVNLMAISEHQRFWPNVKHLFFIKAGTGIGSGIIANGRIYRGARGAAGEIGHIQVEIRRWAAVPLRDAGLPRSARLGMGARARSPRRGAPGRQRARRCRARESQSRRGRPKGAGSGTHPG